MYEYDDDFDDEMDDDFDDFDFFDDDDDEFDDDDYESLYEAWMGDEVDPRELYYTHDFDREDEWWA